MTGQLRPFLTLAARLAWSDDISQRWRQVSVVLAAGLLTLAIGFSAALVSAGAAADQRARDRTPVFAGDVPDPALWVSFRAEKWDGRQFPVQWLYGDADSPLPPGLSELPPPGTMVASPAIANHPEVVGALGLNLAPAGTGPGGTIGQEGLLAASEWFLYASPPEGRTLGAEGALAAVSGFGAPEGTGTVATDRAAPTRSGTVIAVWPLFVVPGLLVAWSCARARSDLRRVRSRTLYRLGFGPSALRAFATVETTSLALPGAVIAALLGGLLLPLMRALPLTGLVLNDRALALPAWWWVLSAVLAVLVVTVMGTVSRSTVRDATATQGTLGREPATARLIPLLIGIALLLVSKGLSGSTGLTALLAGMLITLFSLPLALPVLVRIAGHAVAQARRPAAWLAGHRLANSPQRHGAPAVVLGLLIFIVGGGTGVLGAVTAQPFAATSSSTSTILRLSWRDPQPEDLSMVKRKLPDAVVIPIVDDTAQVESCAELARLFDQPGADCDDPALAMASDNLLALTGMTITVGDPAPDTVVSAVVIGGNPQLTATDVWAATNSSLPAVNLHPLLGPDPLRPPLLVNWLTGGLLAAGMLLALAAAHAFGNRLLALGQEDEQLLRLGLDGQQTRSVQRWTALAPLVPALAVGFCGAVIFSWTGRSQELTGLPITIITAETVAVAAVATTAAAAVGAIQRRRHQSIG